jgi:hypothetical protein
LKQKTFGAHGISWEALHVCIDNATRLGYSEILPDERKKSAVDFLKRARLVRATRRQG